jgi:hypothetical protein
MNFAFTDEQRLFAESVRRFALDRLEMTGAWTQSWLMRAPSPRRGEGWGQGAHDSR